MVKLTKECLAFSKWVSSPACSLMKDDDDNDDDKFLAIEEANLKKFAYLYPYPYPYPYPIDDVRLVRLG